MNKRALIQFVTYSLFALILLISTNAVHAAMTYGSGVYTNMCGTGTDATANSCNRGCNPASGSCSSTQPYVVSYTCDGRQTECRSNESAFTPFQSVSSIACGKTIQIDVFNKVCRVNGGWNCSSTDLQDYIVWYSGDCQTTNNTPTPTLTPIPTSTPTPTIIPISSCDELAVTAGNNAFAPVNVTLLTRASDNRGTIQKYRFYFGNGDQQESTTPQITHRYNVSGTYSVRSEILDSQQVWKTSDACTNTVRVKQLIPIESQRSDCANLFITAGQNSQAPATAKFTLTGYDNKGAIKRYKVDFGNGNTQENDTGNFDQYYDKAGTYTVRGFIQDSENNWKGGENSCNQNIAILTAPITSQPKTGTPTAFTLLGIGSGIAAALYFTTRRLFQVR